MTNPDSDHAAPNPQPADPPRRDPRRLIMRISLLASVLMLGGKVGAYLITHSYAILSDAAESVVHGVATGLAAFSLWYASQPADANHPYGHGRIAYFSAGFEGALVLAAALTVVYSGVIGLIRGPELRNLEIGVAITGGLALINLFLGIALVVIGKRHHSIIVEANGRHVLSDMWTSLAAIIGVTLVMLTGREWLDPAAAILIGAYIGVTGIGLIKTSFGGLMDQLDPTVSAPVIAALEEHVREGRISGFHQLRCRRTNDELWIDVHMLVPGDLPTREAHERVTKVEGLLEGLFPDDKVTVTTHIEPADHAAAHPRGHALADPLTSQS